MEHSGWNTLSMQIKVEITPGPCPQLHYCKKVQTSMKRKNWAQWKEVFLDLELETPQLYLFYL